MLIMFNLPNSPQVYLYPFSNYTTLCFSFLKKTH